MKHIIIITDTKDIFEIEDYIKNNLNVTRHTYRSHRWDTKDLSILMINKKDPHLETKLLGVGFDFLYIKGTEFEHLPAPVTLYPILTNSLKKTVMGEEIKDKVMEQIKTLSNIN